MSQDPAVAASDTGTEKFASSPTAASNPSSAQPKAPKPRSCVVCRSRRVRCDKQSPCSNCRRANITCVLPSTDGPPRWARRLERLNKNGAASRPIGSQNAELGMDKVLDRVRYLENLVKELNRQLEWAHATSGSTGDGPSDFSSPDKPSLDHKGDPRETSPASDTIDLQKQLGRLVLHNTERSRYVSSGFWSRVKDELEELKVEPNDSLKDDLDSSEDEDVPDNSIFTSNAGQRPFDGHAFLFRRSLNPAVQDLHEFQPLPSQIPFLLNVFSESVNFFLQIVHLPTVTKMARTSRGSEIGRLSPSNEALMFSIYYAAIASMEEDDVMTNFGCPKPDLIRKYRLGVEHALANADFLDTPNIVLVQAFAIFLLLLRRQESPRFVYMMTGLLIRMAQFLGLQRDGTHFKHLTPFEIEMRRRVWWAVCQLDLMASEDQGTDLTIISGSFDTNIPLNINDVDISPESKETPTERNGVTDMSFQRTSAALCKIMRQMMDITVKDGAAALKEQDLLLNEIYQIWERNYLQYTTESDDPKYWVAATVARVTIAKMTLIVYLPALLASASEGCSEEIRTKLLISAIEIAEYNHALNAEETCRQWRWIFQSYPHWHAVVCLLMEISQRPWSPIAERAWAALQSRWLIPTQTSMGKNVNVWVPLRQLVIKARKHREDELKRLRANPQAAFELDMKDQTLPKPSSSAPLAIDGSGEFFRDQWRELVGLSGTAGNETHATLLSSAGFPTPSTSTDYASEFVYDILNIPPHMAFDTTHRETNGQKAGQGSNTINISDMGPAWSGIAPMSGGVATQENHELPHDFYRSFNWSDCFPLGSAFSPWLWADSDDSANMFSNLDKPSSDINGSET